MSKSRTPLILGLAVAGGVGYYFYQAGGDPKVAEKKFEADASKLSSDVKGRLPGSEKEIKSDLKLKAEEANQQLEKALDSAKQQAHKVDAKLEAYRSDASKKIDDLSKSTGQQINSAIDKFDKGVGEGAAKGKSWVSGWFGGSK